MTGPTAVGAVPTCRLCGSWSAEHDGPPQRERPAVTIVDDEVVAVIDPELPGVLLAPRSHVEVLTAAPTRAGAVLGALRRAAEVVQASFGATGVTIDPTTELPDAGGHVCYRIVPTLAGMPLPSETGPGVEASSLLAAIRQGAAGDLLPPG